MGTLATIARRGTRWLGFSLVVLGAAGLSVGYMGWKDAASRSVSVTDPATRRVVTRSTKSKPAAGAPARAATATAMATQKVSPTMKLSPPTKLSPTQELLRTTARPPPQSQRAAQAPARYQGGATMSAASPAAARIATAAKQPKAVITTPSTKFERVKRTVAWSAGSLIAGLLLVSASLYESPPRQSRSGADELLNEPVPF